LFSRSTKEPFTYKPNNAIITNPKRERSGYGPRVTNAPDALDEDEFGRLLADCELCSARIRSGLVPFDAACIARGLAAHSGHDEQTALERLARWAASVGGELNGSALLWLPADQFGATP